MTGKDFFVKLQYLFDKVEDTVTELEIRYFVFAVAVLVIMIAKALGLHGLGHLIGIIYVMYFVTFLLDKK
jgi:hypothetical protein